MVDFSNIPDEDLYRISEFLNRLSVDQQAQIACIALSRGMRIIKRYLQDADSVSSSNVSKSAYHPSVKNKRPYYRRGRW